MRGKPSSPLSCFCLSVSLRGLKWLNIFTGRMSSLPQPQSSHISDISTHQIRIEQDPTGQRWVDEWHDRLKKAGGGKRWWRGQREGRHGGKTVTGENSKGEEGGIWYKCAKCRKCLTLGRKSEKTNFSSPDVRSSEHSDETISAH